MSSPVTPPVKGMGGMPKWDEGDKRRAMKKWFTALIVAVIAIWIMLIGWVFVFAPVEDMKAEALKAGVDLTLVLAPVLAAAAGVERLLETIFNVIESGWKSMVAYLGRGLRWLKNAEIEMLEARQWLADMSERYKREMKDLSLSEPVEKVQEKIATANATLELAGRRLADAEKNLAEVTSSSGYKSAKAAATIVLGLMLGEIVAAIGSLQMFAMLGIDVVPARVDVFITGLVIGSGSYPVHSLVGLLQQAKDTLDSAKGALSRTSATRQATAEKPAA